MRCTHVDYFFYFLIFLPTFNGGEREALDKSTIVLVLIACSMPDSTDLLTP